MSEKSVTREQVIKAVEDAAEAWQANVGVPFEEMVAGFLFGDEGYADEDTPREYRLRVIAGADVPAAKKGESFYPFSGSRPYKDDLLMSATAMRDFGHTPIVESRTVQTTYGEWEEDNG